MELITQNNLTMSSYDFLNDVINPARLEAGESEVRNYIFLNRIEDELDDLGGAKTFVTHGNEAKYYDLTFDQMMLVGMRESKAVRKNVLAKLKAMESKPALNLNDPNQLRTLLLNNVEKVIALEHKVEKQEEKIDVLENLFKEGMTVASFCKGLNGVNTQEVNKFLHTKNWLYSDGNYWRVASYARDKYLTEKVTGDYVNSKEEKILIYKQELLKKGAIRLFAMYINGQLPMKKSWNGLFTHDKLVA